MNKVYFQDSFFFFSSFKYYLNWVFIYILLAFEVVYVTYRFIRNSKKKKIQMKLFVTHNTPEARTEVNVRHK